jgi:hypothetical protein
LPSFLVASRDALRLLSFHLRRQPERVILRTDEYLCLEWEACKCQQSVAPDFFAKAGMNHGLDGQSFFWASSGCHKTRLCNVLAIFGRQPNPVPDKRPVLKRIGQRFAHY